MSRLGEQGRSRRWAYDWLLRGGCSPMDALAGAYGPPSLPAAAEAREHRWVRLKRVPEAEWSAVDRAALECAVKVRSTDVHAEAG